MYNHKTQNMTDIYCPRAPPPHTYARRISLLYFHRSCVRADA